MSSDGRADDGAREGTFTRPCERCNQRHPGGLIWLWCAKRFVCPICAVHESYDDAIKAVNKLLEAQARFDPFAADHLRQLINDLRAQHREQLEGRDPTFRR